MKLYIPFLMALVVMCFLSSCQGDDDSSGTTGDTNFTTPDWSEATHSNDVDPNYDIVMAQDNVNSIEITMTSDDWQNIQDDMESKWGTAFGAGGQPQGGGKFSSEEADYVAVSMKCNGLEWYKVGFRLKGNSSLSSTWRNGIYKLPFRLNFDKFEDTYPQIKNQRFYGFKELSMSPGANDNTLIREKVGADIFLMAGIPSARTSFYKVYINFGGGKKYCGIYTMVEVIDDTMIKDQFQDDSGNIYKPESTFQTFTESEFEKKNNTDANDYTDVKATVAALNSTLRTTDAELWRANLETVFNVDHFIKWLAVNTVMLNWDTYGTMAHNYYLYNEPAAGLTWIPWDNNECMMSRGNNSITISLSGISSGWPLIRYIMDDDVYNASYKVYVKDFTDNIFTTENMNALFDKNHDLISPYVIGPEEKEEGKYTQLTSTASFTSALTDLKNHVVTQRSAVSTYLK